MKLKAAKYIFNKNFNVIVSSVLKNPVTHGRTAKKKQKNSGKTLTAESTVI